jgi:hypothetical protein
MWAIKAAEMFWPKKKTKIRGAPAAALRPVRQRIADGKLTVKQVEGIVKRPGKVVVGQFEIAHLDSGF